MHVSWICQKDCYLQQRRIKIDNYCLDLVQNEVLFVMVARTGLGFVSEKGQVLQTELN